jgi:hypothetical protein
MILDQSYFVSTRDWPSAPAADINIFGLADELPFTFMCKAAELTKSSCLFVKDSGQESALA